MKQHTTRQGAFTLIEILVVVGVIALLAALLFPVFGRVRENGRRVTCTNNLRQLGLAFQQYLQDSSGRLPYAGNYQGWGPGLGHWVAGTRMPSGSGLASDSDPFTYNADGRTANVQDGALYPYVKSPEAYMCPSTQDVDKKKLGYSMNCAIAGLNNLRIKTPSDIILLVDEGKSLNDGYFWAVGGSHPNTDELTKAHNGGGNLLFADGHVKYFSFESFPLQNDSDDLKIRVTGTPRFRDLAFGSAGVAHTGSVASPSEDLSTPANRTGPACFGATADGAGNPTS
jgi:prepilin-type processing-associated H-X9-DG protein/prepilin-type N-terminal cleavage/methylation domain-containing protein